jgi:hypothetical protein
MQQQGLTIGVQTGNTPSNRPLVRMISNDEMDKVEAKKEETRRQAEETNNSPLISSLAGHIRAAYTAAINARTIVSERMLKCLRQREGKYEADIAALIEKSNGTSIYMLLTDTKCQALEAWLNDIMIPSGERPYSIEPTPVPDIPPNLVAKAQSMFLQDYFGRVQMQAQQEGVQFDPSMVDQEDFQEAVDRFKKDLLNMIREQAKEDADDLELHIDDELVEGGWYKKLSEFIYDFATYPTAFMEGPTYRRREVLDWVPVEGEMRSELNVIEKIVPEYDRISPHHVYPSPSSKSLQEGNLCVRRRFSRSDLDILRGVEGYDANTIDIILDQYANGYREYLAYDTEIEDLHDRPQESMDPEGHIDGVKFWGNVQGKMLLEWGLPVEKVPDPFREYPIVAYMVGNYVFGAKLNPHPLGRRNIYSASFRKKNDSVWGKAVPELMRDVQNMCNSLARSICNNAALAAGIQVYQLVDLIPPECARTDIYPGKIWEFSSEKIKAAGQKPIEFFQPQLIAHQLMSLYNEFFQQGSEVTGIPAYIYGNQNIGGAGKTASGLSMLMNAAAKGLRNAAKNIDDGVISPSIEEHWLMLMLSRPDLAKGDTEIKARASDYLVQQEALQMRRAEFLSATNNQVDMEIMGIDGRAALLRENAKALKMPPDKIIPSREDMISTHVEQQMQEMIGKLSQVLNIPPEQLIQALQAPTPRQGQQGGQQQQRPRELDVAGNPMAGQAVRQQFN